VSFGTELTIGDLGYFLPYLPETIRLLKVSLIFIPLLGGFTFIYLAGVFSKLFDGRINQVIVGNLYSAGIVGFLAFFLIMKPDTRLTGLLILGGFGVFMLYYVLSTLADVRNIWALRVVSGSVTLFVIGEILVQLVESIFMPSQKLLTFEQILLLKEILFWGFTAASLLALVGIFKTSRNSYLASVGGITSSYIFTLGISLIGSLYLTFIRGTLTEVSPVLSQLSPYIEWMGIVLIAGMVFTVMRRGMSRSMISPAEIGSWSKHVQDTSLYKGEKLYEFTGIINGFIEEGARDHLLVKLFNFLRENRASEAEMSSVLSELINYEDQRVPSFSFAGNAEAIRRSNKSRRMEVLERTVRRIRSLEIKPFGRMTFSDFNDKSLEIMED
jgi:hypothetical protein